MAVSIFIWLSGELVGGHSSVKVLEPILYYDITALEVIASKAGRLKIVVSRLLE